MIPRLNISFPLKRQFAYWFGKAYMPQTGEYMLNHARSGIIMALRAALPKGGRVGVVAYNCHTVANAVVQAGCTPVFIDVMDDLHVDLLHAASLKLDALVLTNLFGIHNDIAEVRKAVGNIPVIVDNAHGYGLPAEGDFTVYSINQGKFPAIGEGGILHVVNPTYLPSIQQQYDALPGYSLVKEIKLYATMLIKAIVHIPLIYTLITLPLKKQRKDVSCHEEVVLRCMAKGVSRMYQSALSSIPAAIELQKRNAQNIVKVLDTLPLVKRSWYGDYAFMLIAQAEDPEMLKTYFESRGIETATHFSRAIEWATEFGYTEGSCPTAERLTKELLMVPTYCQKACLKLKD